MNEYIIFRYYGKYAHFLKAEANASAPSYCVPPRTVLLGLIGAILGLPKDTSQTELVEAKIAVSGSYLCTHWHKGNFRKIPPTPLDYTIKKNQKGSSAESKNTRLCQEWLFKPDFIVWAMLPEKYHSEFCERVKAHRWHFSPSLGLSELFAQIDFLKEGSAIHLPKGNYSVLGVTKRSEVNIDLKNAFENNITIQSIMMPRDLTPQREFSHEFYLREINSLPIPVETGHAWQVGTKKIMWL